MIGNASRIVRERFAQLWADLKSSTDSGLLGVARFLGLLYGPIDRSLPIDQAFRKALRYRLAAHVGWRHLFGGVTYLLFIVLVITGVLLSFHYRPSVEEAYPSVQHIVSEVSFGWLIRDVHVWAASLLVLALLFHMARVFIEASYKPPRETNWLIGLLLLFVVIGFGMTGYLLPWDQSAYWIVTEVIDAVSAFPLLGSIAGQALAGDAIVSGATLSRFFAIHVIILPWISFVLLAYHFTLVRRRGIAAPPEASEDDAHWRVSTAMTAEELEKFEQNLGTPFFPNHLLRSFSVAVLTLALLVTLAALFPRPIGDPANPYQIPNALVSTWIPADVALALIRYVGPLGFALFTLLALSLAFLPLFDRREERRFKRRPVAASLAVVFVVVCLIAWFAGRRLRSAPPEAEPHVVSWNTSALPGSARGSPNMAFDLTDSARMKQ